MVTCIWRANSITKMQKVEYLNLNRIWEETPSDTGKISSFSMEDIIIMCIFVFTDLTLFECWTLNDYILLWWCVAQKYIYENLVEIRCYCVDTSVCKYDTHHPAEILDRNLPLPWQEWIMEHPITHFCQYDPQLAVSNNPCSICIDWWNLAGTKILQTMCRQLMQINTNLDFLNMKWQYMSLKRNALNTFSINNKCCRIDYLLAQVIDFKNCRHCK